MSSEVRELVERLRTDAVFCLARKDPQHDLIAANSEEAATTLESLLKRVEELEGVLRTLIVQREGHYSTLEAWDDARATLQKGPDQ